MNSTSGADLARTRAIARRSRGERRVTYALKVIALIVLCTIALSWIVDFLGRIRSVTIIVVGATFFTYAIYPMVRRLNTRLPFLVSILIVYAGIALVVLFGVAFVLPALADDTRNLIAQYPAIEHNVTSAISNPANPLIRALPPNLRDYLVKLPAEFSAAAQRYAGMWAERAIAILFSVVAVIATVVVIPVLSIYLMIEAEGLRRALVDAIPARGRAKTLAVLHDLDIVLGGFIRGQLTVGATIGTLIAIALLVLHVRYAVLIGVVAGLLDVIPYVGALVGFVPAVLLALFNDGWQHALVVAAVFIAIFQLEGHFIAPKIVSDSVGLSPLMVIIAILVGGELGSIGGMFLAVPIAAILRVLVLHSLPRGTHATAGSLVEPPRTREEPVEGEPFPRPQGARA